MPIFCGYLSLPYLALLFGCCMIFLMNLSNSLYLFVQRIFWHPCILQLPSHCSIPHCMERCCHSHHLLYRFPILMDTVSIQMDDQNRKILEIQMLSSIAALAKKGNDKAILNFIAIPETLPVDSAELSICFANALENAIKACEKLPTNERKIIIRCIHKPAFMFEIKNPYQGKVSLGRNISFI